MIKYRLKEVATDFDVAAKEITEILAQYGEKPKSTSQVMTDEELNKTRERHQTNWDTKGNY